MGAPIRFHRNREIQKVQNELEHGSFPRLQMSLLVALTGAAGFVASFALLHLGMSTMWSRYLLSFGVAYGAFLLLLWLWLRSRAEDYLDLADIPGDLSFPSGSDSGSGCGSSEAIFSGKGGTFDGGGASGFFDNPLENAAAASDGASVSDASPIGDALGAVADADELAIPLALIVLVGALLLSSVFMIYSAPVLFAELIVDGLLSASLYRRLRGLRTEHWLKTALRRTVWPFVLTAALVSAAGWVMGQSVPGAHTVGEVIFSAKQGS